MATSIEIIPATVPITVTQGDTLGWTTTISENDAPVDISGDSVTVTVEYTNSQANILVLSSDDDTPQITLDDAGNAVVLITSAQTADIAVGDYFYSLKWEKVDGTIRTLLSGPFTIMKPVV